MKLAFFGYSMTFKTGFFMFCPTAPEDSSLSGSGDGGLRANKFRLVGHFGDVTSGEVRVALAALTLTAAAAAGAVARDVPSYLCARAVVFDPVSFTTSNFITRASIRL